MTMLKYIGLSLALVIITACSKNDDKEHKDSIEQNLEQIALKPLITFPSDNSTIKGQTEVRVDVDSSVEYSKLTLLVNGVSVEEDSEAPYVFTWNPYFVQGTNSVSLLVKAETTDGNNLRSETISLTIDRSEESDLSEIISINESEQIVNSFPFNTKEALVEWSPIIGAEQYQYRVGSNEPSNVVSNETNINIDEGINIIYVRAIADDQWGEWIDVGSLTVQAPNIPKVTFDSAGEPGVLAVSTQVDENADVKSTALIVNGIKVLEKDSPPYSFNWDPYYFSESSSTEWWVETTLADGRVLRSTSNNIDNIAQDFASRMEITLPEDGPIYKNIDSIPISWNELPGARSYEYSLSGIDALTGASEEEAVLLTGLSPGFYSVRLRAIDEFGNKGAWSSSIDFTIALPDAPEFTAPDLFARFSDVGEVNVTWTNIQDVDRYEYRMSGGEWQALNSPSLVIATPEVGQFRVEVRAVDNLIRPGPASEMSFEVVQPELPQLFDPEIVWESGQFQVTLSWSEESSGNTYQVWWNGASDPIETDSSSIVVPVESAGSYSWSIQRINSFGHESGREYQADIDVGFFRTQLGGLRNERAIDLVRASGGGYFVLASTTSRELDLNVNISSSQPAPWIIQLNETGEVQNETILPSPERIQDLVEDEQGNIYLAGYDWNAEIGLLYKFNKNLELIWRKEYASASSDERFDFTELEIWAGELFVVGSTWKTEDNVIRRDFYNLMVISPEDGLILEDFPLANIDSRKIDGIGAFKVINGKKYLAGTIQPPEEINYGQTAFLIQMDELFSIEESWLSEDHYTFLNVGDFVFSEAGEKVFVIGQGDFGSIGVAALSSSDLTQLVVESNFGDDIFYSPSTRISSNGGPGIFTLLEDQNEYPYPHPMVLVEFDDNLLEISRKYLLEESGYVSGQTVLRNPDGSLTMLFQQGKNNDSDDYDIVIKRFLLN